MMRDFDYISAQIHLVPEQRIFCFLFNVGGKQQYALSITYTQDDRIIIAVSRIHTRQRRWPKNIDGNIANLKRIPAADDSHRNAGSV